MHNNSNAVYALLEIGTHADCDLSKITDAINVLSVSQDSRFNCFRNELPSPTSPTPLCLAARLTNKPSIIRLLLQAGADICRANNDWEWPILALAIQAGNDAVALELLPRGCDLSLSPFPEKNCPGFDHLKTPEFDVRWIRHFHGSRELTRLATFQNKQKEWEKKITPR